MMANSYFMTNQLVEDCIVDRMSASDMVHVLNLSGFCRRYGGRVPLTAACAPHFYMMKIHILEHHLASRQ